MTPKRIQRKRTAGWKMPAHTKYVGRGSRWGNPFVAIPTAPIVWEVVSALYEKPALDVEFALNRKRHRTKEEAVKTAVACYKKWLIPLERGDDLDVFLKTNAAVIRDIQHNLAGYNLACWCKENETCHADFLLEVANKWPKP